MKNALNNQVGMLVDMFLWLVANLKQGGIYFIKQALPPNKSAGSVCIQVDKLWFKYDFKTALASLYLMIDRVKVYMPHYVCDRPALCKPADYTHL